MKKLIILIIFIIYFSICCQASDNTDSAREFINKFLKAEYIGDTGARLDNTIYSPERKLWVDENYSPMIGEIPQWDADQICVVDSYKIKKITIESQTAIIDIEFQEFARTNGEKGAGDGPLIKTEKKNEEKYYLKYKDGRWWIYNPPMPRISKKALIDYNSGIIKRMGEWVLQEGSDQQKDYYNNLVNTNELLKDGDRKLAH